MRPLFVVLIALGTALISGGIGFVAGAGIAGISGGVIGGALGVCITTETAQAQGYLTPSESQAVTNKVLARLAKASKNTLEQAGATVDSQAKIDCQDLMKDLPQ